MREGSGMKALSVVYPAGTDIAAGKKSIEIRSWLPPVLPLRELLIVENHHRLEQEGESDPIGLAVAMIDIIGVHPWTLEEAERCGHRYVAGYYAWEIENIKVIDTPFRANAERSIYNVDVDEEI